MTSSKASSFAFSFRSIICCLANTKETFLFKSLTKCAVFIFETRAADASVSEVTIAIKALTNT